ncbi:efflux RND transporter periplasmic adaptor subunit [Xanthomonas albilineans]|uniref:efflux RND transporter periplasmic adaptor subunit n=1 Tax=Xanthomonas albilineans TaxID=29447 RepID=UPI0005F31C3E|nr:efflux RND transporter periplasmic adaptor subunit [Xanthomonas albilineans]
MPAPFARWRRCTLLLILSGAILVSAGCNGVGGVSPPSSPKTVEVVTLRPQRVALSVELAGRTVASEESEVRPQVSGILRRRLFEEGATVHAGQPLFQIEPTLYQAAVNQAQATLATTEATLAAATLRAERYRALGKSQLAAQQDVDDAQAAYKQALAGRDAQRAVLDTARTQLRFATVLAPIGGRIGRARVTPGALVTANQVDAIAKIQRLDPMNVDITQSSSQFLALRRAIAAGGVQQASAPVRLTLSDGSTYPLPGMLQFADIDVDETTSTVTLRARFPNPDVQLLPGMYVRALVGQGVRQQALLVPQAAVDRTPRGDAVVWVVGADDVVRQRQFTTLRAVGDQWLVGEGLKPGERVVVAGQQGLSDGARVVVKPRVATAALGQG